jgi:hypothetical protein
VLPSDRARLHGRDAGGPRRRRSSARRGDTAMTVSARFGRGQPAVAVVRAGPSATHSSRVASATRTGGPPGGVTSPRAGERGAGSRRRS